MSASLDPRFDGRDGQPKPARGSLSAADQAAITRRLGRSAKSWEVLFEEDYEHEVAVVVLHRNCEAVPSFLVCREDGFLSLTTFLGDQHSFEGLFTSIDGALAVLERRLAMADADSATLGCTAETREAG